MVRQECRRVEVLLIVLLAVGWALAIVLGVLYVRLLEQHGRAHHDRLVDVNVDRALPTLSGG
jgi:hypothetical protein